MNALSPVYCTSVKLCPCLFPHIPPSGPVGLLVMNLHTLWRSNFQTLPQQTSLAAI